MITTNREHALEGHQRLRRDLTTVTAELTVDINKLTELVARDHEVLIRQAAAEAERIKLTSNRALIVASICAALTSGIFQLLQVLVGYIKGH